MNNQKLVQHTDRINTLLARYGVKFGNCLNSKPLSAGGGFSLGESRSLLHHHCLLHDKQNSF